MSDLLVRVPVQDLSPARDLIEEARSGRMFILVNDEDGEGAGHVVLPAGFATAEAVNFMARYARGLICLAMTPQRVAQLGLAQMGQSEHARQRNAFTVSIEAARGVSTGISAKDRARTIAIAVDPGCGPDDIVSPGHVFPLVALEGGCLAHAGHAEASVDIARLAGLNPAAVICGVMNDDGTMARMSDLVAFAYRHNLRVGTIAELIAHRRRTERLVRVVATGVLHHETGGQWRIAVYASTVEYAEHVILMKGDLAAPDPAMVVIHGIDVIDDILGGHGGTTLQDAMAMIADEGRGAVLLLRERQEANLSDRVRLRDPVADAAIEPAEIAIGSQILIDVGVRNLILVSRTTQCGLGLEAYGLRIVEKRPIERRY